MSFIKELWKFMKVRKKFWLLPVFLMLALFGGLVVFTQGTAVAPFIYALFQLMSIILGISAFYHDSASTLLIDGKIVAAAQEERFTRKKHDSAFPKKSIFKILNQAKINFFH